MIRLLLNGGLGNQMFQYAAGLSLASKINTELVLDLTFLETNLPVKHFTKRNYTLDIFNIQNKLVHRFSSSFLNSKIGYLVLTLENLRKKNKFVESGRLFDSVFISNEQKLKHFFSLSDGAYLEGYFHDYNYFGDIAHKLIQIFDTDKLYDPLFLEDEEFIKSKTAVSVAIRRGDYLNPKNKNKYVQLDDTYYKTAISTIKKRISDPHFFIFSYDYPEGMYKPFGLKESEYTLIDKDKTGTRFKTYLRLQSLCNHNIISNSTFSYWSAFLNKHSDKIVIGPDRWENRLAAFNYPPGWEVINV